VLNPAGFNTNVYSLVNGQSIGGELNGHVQDANLAVGQTIESRHIRPYEGHRGEWAGSVTTLDFYEHLFGTVAEEADWIMVPGASKRVYCPWPAHVGVYQVSAFISNFRMREVSAPPPVTDPQVYVWDNAPHMYISMFIDGVRQGHTLRRLPTTYYPVAGFGDPNYLYGRENVLTHHFDLVAVTGDMSPGWHDVSLAVLIPQNTGLELIYPLYDTDAAAKTDHDVTHRIRIGIKAASILALP
jgi:hypothetical protein